MVLYLIIVYSNMDYTVMVFSNTKSSSRFAFAFFNFIYVILSNVKYYNVFSKYNTRTLFLKVTLLTINRSFHTMPGYSIKMAGQ